MRRVEGTFRLVKLAFIIFSAIILMVSFNVMPTFATDDATFSTIRNPVGVSAGFDPPGTSHRIFVTTPLCGNPRRVFFIDSRGRDRRFHTLDPRPAGVCARDDIAFSSSLGGFPKNFIYVTQGPKIWEITPDGSSHFEFLDVSISDSVNGSTCTNLHSSYITFDEIGSFDLAMIFTCAGRVWKVKSDKVVSLIATLPGDATLPGNPPVELSGPDVIPKTYIVTINGTAFAGPILAAGVDGKIYAVTPVGWAEVGSKPGAKAIHVIPPVVCSVGTQADESKRAAFFLARTDANQVRRLPSSSPTPDPSDPAPDRSLQGNELRILVTTNNSSEIHELVWGNAVTTFHTLTFTQDKGGSDFCPRLKAKILIKPTTYAQKYSPDSQGNIPVVLLGSDNFDVTTVKQDSLKFGATGTESSWSHCDGFSDQNGDGYLDLKCHFRWSQTELTPTSTQAVLTGTQNPPFEAFD